MATAFYQQIGYSLLETYSLPLDMATLIIHPISKQKLKAIKAGMRTLEISFEEHTYDPNFVAEILRTEQNIKEGKGVKIATEDLWK